MRIFHLVDRDAWAAAERAGEYRPASLEHEGYVHFSFAHQVRATWQRYYAEVPNLFVIEVTGLPVTVENGFPHVYQAIPISAVVGAYELKHPMFSAAGPEAEGR